MPDQVSATDLEQWVRAFAQLVAENKDHLTELDSAIGDGDHGNPAAGDVHERDQPGRRIDPGQLKDRSGQRG